MVTHRVHEIIIERPPGRWQAGWRIVRVPTLGLRTTKNGSTEQLLSLARKMIDRHIDEHGNAPVRKEAPTDEERARLYKETFGGF